MQTIDQYLKCERGLLIAPAGHGKTTTIAECLLKSTNALPQLVLTHTHAGIASLRAKFQKKNVNPLCYQLETITGFAQRLVLALAGNSELPGEEDNTYFECAVSQCAKLLEKHSVQIIIRKSYSGAYVDEYQDCTRHQHEMIMALCAKLPLHILGDPMQGIFDFEKERIVSFNEDLCSFNKYDFLQTPWRWFEINQTLGEQILKIRQLLEANEEICLTAWDAIEAYEYPKTGRYDPAYNRPICQILNSIDRTESVLVLCPSYKEANNKGVLQLRGSLHDRIDLKSRIDFSDNFLILDAIDGAEYYSCAKHIDEYLSKCGGKRIKKIAWLYDILDAMHVNATSLNLWINRKDNRLKDRRKEKSVSAKLHKLFEVFDQSATIKNFMNLVRFIFSIKGIKCHHKELFLQVRKAASIAESESISLYDAMRILKNRTRIVGRATKRHCIGTTLLTKGLEFDNVIICDADKFEDAKNFYVAISRARKRLVLFYNQNYVKFSL